MGRRRLTPDNRAGRQVIYGGIELAGGPVRELSAERIPRDRHDVVFPFLAAQRQELSGGHVADQVGGRYILAAASDPRLGVLDGAGRAVTAGLVVLVPASEQT